MPEPVAQVAAPEPAVPEPVAPTSITRYYCRVHQDRQVNWRGRDCPDCQRDRAERAAERA